MQCLDQRCRLQHALAALDLTLEQNKQRELLMLAHRKEAIALTSRIETADVDVDQLLAATRTDTPS